MKRNWKRALLASAALVLASARAPSNNLAVTNVTTGWRDDTTAYVLFDVSWENAWRWTNINHDAAWVFFKVQLDGETNWRHVTLEGTGVNPADYSAGAGTPIEIVVPNDKVGLFVRKSEEGAGDVSLTGVKAVWNFSSNGLVKTDQVRVQAFAVEMVYVAEGEFSVGDGASSWIWGQLEAGTNGTPFTITNEAYSITLGGGGAGSLGNNNAAGVGTADDFNDTTSKTLPAAFPNGYAAFYGMKYEITQGQYADFLNALTRDQQTTRCTATTLNNYMSGTAGGSATVQFRNTVRLTENPGSPAPRGYTTVTPDRACNWLSWADGAAFADWSGLRPMTELEFEKACRGPLASVTHEYAWGTTVITAQTGHSGSDGSGTETATPAGANCCYSNKMGGPVRAGIYARATSSREAAGASYWGIMELSGNIWERPVSIGNATGRGFTGLHGNGVLAAGGDANVANWPGTSATGAGGRGGHWNFSSGSQRVSQRYYAAFVAVDRWDRYGWRGVRTAPQ